jgi:hypothetical protein
METKVVVMPPPTKRRIRIRIGITVYELSVNVAMTPVALSARAHRYACRFEVLPEVESGPRAVKSGPL